MKRFGNNYHNDPDETDGRALYRQRAQNQVFLDAFLAGDHRKVRWSCLELKEALHVSS